MTTSTPDYGHIFTTEPMAMRAFAAELRHDLGAASRLVRSTIPALSDRTDLPLAVTCEVTDQSIDVVLAYADLTVGIEGKIGHELSADQAERELSAADHLIVLVKDRDDVEESLRDRVGIVTWQEALAYFVDARISMADIDAVNDSKRQARRVLRTVDTDRFPAGWAVQHHDGGTGFPSVSVWGPDLTSDRRLVIQVEMDRDMSARFVVNIGISVDEDDFPYFGASSREAPRPEWISYAKRVGDFMKERLAGASSISSRAGSSRPPSAKQAEAGIKQSLSQSKIAQARHFGLPMNYATGYTDSYIGVRTVKVAPDDVASVTREVFAAVVELQADLVKQPVA